MQIQTADRMQRASIRDSMNLIRDVLTKVPVKVGGGRAPRQPLEQCGKHLAGWPAGLHRLLPANRHAVLLPLASHTSLPPSLPPLPSLQLEPGSKEELQHRRNLKHADKADRAFAKEPLAVRLVQEKHLLPPEVHSRLRRACGLPAGGRRGVQLLQG